MNMMMSDEGIGGMMMVMGLGDLLLLIPSAADDCLPTEIG
jgi:hypothetical protein